MDKRYYLHVVCSYDNYTADGLLMVTSVGVVQSSEISLLTLWPLSPPVCDTAIQTDRATVCFIKSAGVGVAFVSVYL